MTKPTTEEHAAACETTAQRESNEALGPLIKEAGQPIGTHGRGHDKTVFNLDLERYVGDFNERTLDSYTRGTESAELPADIGLARSLVPPGTARLRDFSYLAPEIPELVESQCVGCMKCVTECPDTAILGKVAETETLENHLESVSNETDRAWIRQHWTHTRKYFDGPEKLGEKPGFFGIFIDPSKCKGCGECVTACGKHGALRMIPKDENTVPRYRQGFEFFQHLPPTPEHFIRDQILVDMMLNFEKTLLYTGGAGSCAGCGEATAIRMMLAATGYRYDRTKIGVVAATGCNTVYGSTYPYNPFLVSWTNSLFENAPAVAMGIRLRWDQQGQQDRRLWVLGGDGAMYDIGFQSLSRLLASGMDIKILVLDTQVYSNTGGQTSTASFTGQGSKMSPHGSAIPGKQETRKELARIAMMHPDCFVAQTTPAYPKHFYQSILDANEFPGPALINVYTACQPEHGIADDRAAAQAKLAVKSRAFPLFVHDPRKGERLSERLSLQGNSSWETDWTTDKRTGKPLTFIDFARTEGRFAAHFDAEGLPSPTLRRAEAQCLASWRLLQDLAR